MKLEVGGKKNTAVEEENWGSHDPHTGRSAMEERDKQLSVHFHGVSAKDMLSATVCIY